jgi:hypothetical protein
MTRRSWWPTQDPGLAPFIFPLGENMTETKKAEILRLLDQLRAVMPIQGTRWKDMRAFRLLKQIRREIELTTPGKGHEWHGSSSIGVGFGRRSLTPTAPLAACRW